MSISDSVAFVRALALGVSGGLITAAIASLVKRESPRIVRIILGLGMAIGLTTLLFFTWPTLATVPDLANLSQAEAETRLQKCDLIPIATPQYSTQTQAGRVVPLSQDPAKGLRVRRLTAVRFGVSVDNSSAPPVSESVATVRVFDPKSSQAAICKSGPDGIRQFAVSGISKGLSKGHTLLLWAKPVKPPSEQPGWYLQKSPNNGITSALMDGRWDGLVQIGNPRWPPHDGDIVDVAVTVVDTQSANQLLDEPGVVTRSRLPGNVSDVSSGLHVELR